MQSSQPNLQVIVPAAAFGGSIISFVLGPSELVKVDTLRSCVLQNIICIITYSVRLIMTLNFSSVGCKFRAPIH